MDISFTKAFNRAANDLGYWFLPLLRLVFGSLFALAGANKLLHPEIAVEAFQAWGMIFPHSLPWLIGGVELVAGVFLILGLYTRLFSLLLSLIMIVALGTAHRSELSSFFQDPSVIVQVLPFPYLLASLILLFRGPGGNALDQSLQMEVS